MRKTQESRYFDYVFRIDGENISPRPENIFDPSYVFLIIDMELNLIWIWSGEKSRLFHRYIAANWAGKLKSRNKKFLNYKYEVVKEGREPEEFKAIYNEINSGRKDFDFPGHSRSFLKNVLNNNRSNNSQTNIQPQENFTRDNRNLSNSRKAKISLLFTEIKEMQKHINYTFKHMERKLIDIEKLLK